MATTLDAPQPDVDVAPTRLSDEKIAQDRAKAQQLPTQPMDAADSDVIIHPSDSNSTFNNMASKLDAAMKEVMTQNKPTEPVKEKSTAPDTSDKVRTDSQQKPPATTEVAPEDKTITSAKAADWKVIKEKAKVAEAKALETEQKLSLISKEYEEFKKKAVDMAALEDERKRLTEIQTERDSLKKQIETVALERSAEFRASYDAKFNEALNRAKDAVGAKAEQIESLMQLPPSKWRKEQINSIREELTGVDQGQLDVALSEYDQVRKDRESALKDNGDNYKKLLGLQAEKQNRAKELETHRMEAAINSVLSMAKEKYDAFKPGDSPESTQAAEANVEKVRRFYKGQLDPRELALMPIQAAEHERLTKNVLPALEAKVKELEATLAEYDKSTPRPAGGQPATNQGATKGKSFIDTFNANWPDTSAR